MEQGQGHKGPRKPLSAAEYDRRRREGVCIYCGGGGHQKAECPSRLKHYQPQRLQYHDDTSRPASERHQQRQRQRQRHRHRNNQQRQDQRGRNDEPQPSSGAQEQLRHPLIPNDEPAYSRNPQITNQPNNTLLYNNEAFHDHRRQVINQPSARLPYHDDPTHARKRDISTVPGVGLPYDNDVVPHRALASHHADTVRDAALSRPTKVIKEPIRGQFISGLFRPNGPARLVHGTEAALTELEFASSRGNLTIVQQPPISGQSNIIEAFTISLNYLKVNNKRPTSFLPLSLGQLLQGSEETGKLQTSGMPPFKALNISRALNALYLVSTWYQAETGIPTNCQLGILTHQGRGQNISLRAQLFTAQVDQPGMGTKTIWLYRRVEESTTDGYVEQWRGFGTRTERENESAILNPLHPVTKSLLERQGDSYLMPTKAKSVFEFDASNFDTAPLAMRYDHGKFAYGTERRLSADSDIDQAMED